MYIHDVLLILVVRWSIICGRLFAQSLQLVPYCHLHNTVCTVSIVQYVLHILYSIVCPVCTVLYCTLCIICSLCTVQCMF